MKNTSRRGRPPPVPLEVESSTGRYGARGHAFNDQNPKKLGNIRILHQFKNKRLLVIGPDWFYSTIMLGILSFIAIGFVFFTLPRLNRWYHWLAGLNIVTSCIVSFVATVIKDPGIVRATYRDFQALKEHLPFNTKDVLSTSSDDGSADEDDSDDDLPSSTEKSSETGSGSDSGNRIRPSNEQRDVIVESQAGKQPFQFETVGTHSMAKASPQFDSEDELSAMELRNELSAATFGNPTRNPLSGSPDGDLTPPTLGDRYLQDLENQAERVSEASAPRRYGADAARSDPMRRASPAAPTRSELIAARRRRLRRRSQPMFCDVCGLTPPAGSHHCEDCEVCIEGYDHHCPWTSKCIGKGNVCEFYTWLFTGLLSMVYMGVMTGISVNPLFDHRLKPKSV